MENNRLVIDTSVFIEFLRAKNKLKTTLYNIADGKNICISSVTLYELLMGATGKEKIKDVKSLTEGLNILPFNEEVARKASEIYHDLRVNNKMIEFRDIFISATAIVNDAPLLSLNRKHFERIKELELL